MKTSSLIAWDNPRSLFPLRTNSVSALLAEKALQEHVINEVLDQDNKTAVFAQATTGYALKDPIHNRRILVLDPFSTYFLYDFLLDNKAHFGASANGSRQRYGYSLRKSGKPRKPTDEYARFRRRKYRLKKSHDFFAQVDIVNCFNSFYHHNVATYVASELGQVAGMQIGQFLREINGGNSVGCFPQGIFPAKAIGNAYLSFTEHSGALRSSAIIRFMDDFFFFDDREHVVLRDIARLQEIIGEHYLALNSAKTRIGSKQDDFDEHKLDSIKKSLLQKRAASSHYEDEPDDESEDVGLNEEEAEYLKDLIRLPNLGEEDVELVLSLLRNDPEEALHVARLVLTHYPHLLKSLYWQVRHLPDDVPIWEELCDRLKCQDLSEFELFWLLRIAIDHFDFDQDSADFVFGAIQHPSAGVLVEAAVLECRSLDFGLLELKKRRIRDGGAGLTGYAASIGLLCHEKGQRNQLYKYAMKHSTGMHALLGELCAIDPDVAARLDT